jgi:phage portal protein BeeE
LARVLRRPNSYETFAHFMLNAVRSLYLDGNCFALAERNDRYEVAALHLMNPRLCTATAVEDGEIFFTLGGNDIVTKMLGVGAGEQIVVPQRDVFHVALHAADHRRP